MDHCQHPDHINRQDPAAATWSLVTTRPDESEQERRLCGDHYTQVAAALRLFDLPFVSRVE